MDHQRVLLLDLLLILLLSVRLAQNGVVLAVYPKLQEFGRELKTLVELQSVLGDEAAVLLRSNQTDSHLKFLCHHCRHSCRQLKK